MNEDDGVTMGSGNVFADMGLPNPEERLLKAQLAMQIQRFIDQKGWTHAQVAEAIGMEQGQVSLMLRGRLSGISVARLLDIVNRLGHDVEVRISEAERDPQEAQVLVRVA